jgi:hypothetical protein
MELLNIRRTIQLRSETIWQYARLSYSQVKSGMPTTLGFFNQQRLVAEGISIPNMHKTLPVTCPKIFVPWNWQTVPVGFYLH